MQAVPPPWRHPLQRAVLAYHLFQLHASEGVPHYASQSTAHCFPHETIKICMYLAVHAMMHCLAHSGDGELPWLLKYRQEFIAKSHFEKIKQAFRGQPSVRDGLYGTLLLHWNQCRGKDRFSNSWTPEPWLTEAEATSIAAESLKDALFLQSRNSRQRSEQQIKQQLKESGLSHALDISTPQTILNPFPKFEPVTGLVGRRRGEDGHRLRCQSRHRGRFQTLNILKPVILKPEACPEPVQA